MNERLNVFNEKMEKSYNSLTSELERSVQDVQTHMYWIS